jgi:hypothetical protein
VQEAAALHRAIEDAIARMAQAVRWLTQELPLNSTPVVTLVTAVGPGGAAASGDLPFPGSPAAAAAAVGGAEFAAGVAPGAAERIVYAFPRFKQPLDIPIAAEDGPLLGGGDRGSGMGEEEAEGGGDKGGAGGSGGGDGDSAVAVNVWLHSPLGPAVAGITTAQLRRSADAGGAPVTLTATPREAEEAPAPASRSKLEVQVQFTATWLPPPAAPQRRRLSSMLLPTNSGSSGSVVVGGTNGGSSGLMAMLAVLCVPLLAGWLDLPAAAAGFPAVQVLQSVAFLVSSIAAVIAIVVLQLKSWSRQAPVPQASLRLA